LSVRGKGSKDIFVLMNGKWVPANEIDFNIKVPEVFFKVWDVEVLQALLDSAIKNEEYETAAVLHNVMKEKTNEEN
ncbi:hypothetical protein LCGC14_2396200, partial [marine sediment metagenome]